LWVRRDKTLFKDVVHKGITCDLCKMNPIVGIRYKSATKGNFDLCIDCEAREGCNDVFLKIKWPEDYDKYMVEQKEEWIVEAPIEEESIDLPMKTEKKELDSEVVSTLPFDGYTAPLEKDPYLNITIKMRNTGSLPWSIGTTLKNGYYIASAV